MKRPTVADIIASYDSWPSAQRHAHRAARITNRRWYVRANEDGRRRWLVTTLPRADRTRPRTHRCHARECRSCVYVDIANGRKP